jgi:hypothetical protein
VACQFKCRGQADGTATDDENLSIDGGHNSGARGRRQIGRSVACDDVIL